MKPKLSPQWADLLEYLEGIGYTELYLEGASAHARTLGSGGAPNPHRSEQSAVSTARFETLPKPTDRPAAASPGPESRRSKAPESAPRTPETARPRAAAATSTATLEVPPHVGPMAELLEQPVPEGLGERFEALMALGRGVRNCRRCGLCERRKTVVFGSGNPDANLMLVGEGPGAEEDRRGLPFVGPAGELLSRIIQAIDLEREMVYIANMVKCRPPGNRDPQPGELAACRDYLERQIDLVRPKVLVALGRVAAQALLGSSEPLGRLRGRWYSVRGIDTRVTYHPAALLRNSKFKRPTWEDMKVVRARLQGGAHPGDPS